MAYAYTSNYSRYFQKLTDAYVALNVTFYGTV